MKKLLLGCVAMAGMLFATSCAKDVEVADGSKTTVTFSVNVDKTLQTRAYGDGKTATKLYYQVFDNEASDNKGVLDDLGEVTLENLATKEDISIELVKGNTYTVVFWAQAETNAPYDLTAFPTVKYGAGFPKNNDENGDAFFAKVDNITTASPRQSVTLTRPFAQINMGLELPASMDEIHKSEMKVTGAYTGMNLLTGDLVGDGTTPVVFASNDVPDDSTLAITSEPDITFTYLSMAYVFVNDGNVSVEFELNNNTNGLVDARSAENVPVRVNYRTLLYGKMQTGNVDFGVTIVPGFGENDTEQDIDEEQPGDEPGEEAITITDIVITPNAEDGTIEFIAELDIPEGQSVTSAAFVCTPTTLTRAEEGVVTIPAEVSGEYISATVTASEVGLDANKGYKVSVLINGETTIEAEGEVAADATFTAPEDPSTTEPDPTPEAGTLEKPFTVAEAIAKAKETGETVTEQGYYIKGIVASVTEQFGAQYGNATFTMIDAGVPDAIFTAYRVFYKAESQMWTTSDDTVEVGDEVIVYGQIVNFKGDTPEVTDKTGYLYQFVSQVPTISGLKATVGEDGKSVTFTANYTNRASVAISKAGFKYGIENTNTDKSVDNPADKSGTITAQIGDLEPGKYNVVAYLNDLETAVVSFTIKDPNTEVPTQTYVDVLDYSYVGATGTSYTSWSNKQGSKSEAVYAGNSAGGNNSIQLRSSTSNNSTIHSGIISTTSGGTAKKVVVTWNSNTTTGNRTLDVYGKTTAYASADDLYSNDTQGTKLGSITCGNETELVIEGDYAFIGLRSNNGAMYLDEIQITWEK